MIPSKAEKLTRIVDAGALSAPGEARRHYVPEAAAGDPRRGLQAHPRLYALAHDLLTPSVAANSWRDFIADPDGPAVVVNLGGGVRELHPGMVNVDMLGLPATDLVTDFAGVLPIHSASVDAVISIAVLEHVPDPALHSAEIARIVKPGGVLYAAVPFLYPFHAAPGDYTRWTAEGLARLFSAFEPVAVGNHGGVAGVLILVLAHFIAQILCFGSPRLYAWANLGALALFAPIKLLDIVLRRLPFSTTVCPTLYFVGRRRAGPVVNAPLCTL